MGILKSIKLHQPTYCTNDKAQLIKAEHAGQIKPFSTERSRADQYSEWKVAHCRGSQLSHTSVQAMLQSLRISRRDSEYLDIKPH